MRSREVRPELLDHLPENDPQARRSRRDLRRINFLMGNERWICRTIREFPAAASRGIVELGSGDGALIGKLARLFPETSLSACDLAPRPQNLHHSVVWKQGDVLSESAPLTGGVLVANLFLHHFEGGDLRRIGRLCADFEVVIFSEPARGRLPHILGAALWPFVNRVTRHDMHVSINAGFAPGELPGLLGLDPEGWRFSETCTWRGAGRVLGWRA